MDFDDEGDLIIPEDSIVDLDDMMITFPGGVSLRVVLLLDDEHERTDILEDAVTLVAGSEDEGWYEIEMFWPDVGPRTLH